jgi:hypothetical protein
MDQPDHDQVDGDQTESDQTERAPGGIDISTPSIARIYDYLLGGSHNFAVDRAMARRMTDLIPLAKYGAQTNRAFMHRAVRYMVDAGIRQFLDIGSGIPTVGNTHEIAQKANPDAKIVYVDLEPVAVTYSEQILCGNDGATVIRADFRDPATILSHPRTRRLLDLSQPLGLLMVALLHAVPETDDPHTTVQRYYAALAPGSHVAISHGTSDGKDGIAVEASRLAGNTSTPLTGRNRQQVAAFLSGLELIEPGVVWAPEWRPDDPEDAVEPERSWMYAAVGRRR